MNWCLKNECRNSIYSYFKKSRRKKVHATIPKGNLGYDRYTVPGDCSCWTYYCCFLLALANTFSWPFVPILSNFSKEQWIQNHPQCLSGLSWALFQTTFLEIAVYWWRVTTQIWVMLLIGWNFQPFRSTHFSDVISQGNQLWHWQMLAIFSGYLPISRSHKAIIAPAAAI